MPDPETTPTPQLDSDAVLDLVKTLDEPVTDESVATLAGAPVAAVATVLDDLVTAGQLSQDDDGFYSYIPDDPNAVAVTSTFEDESDEPDEPKPERVQLGTVLTIPNVKLAELLSTLHGSIGGSPVATGSRVVIGKPGDDGTAAFVVEINGVCRPPQVREDFNRDMVNPQMDPLQKHMAERQAQVRLQDRLREEREQAELAKQE